MQADEMLADAKWKNALAIGEHQGAIDLRASASTVERGIRSRSLRGMSPGTLSQAVETADEPPEKAPLGLTRNKNLGKAAGCAS
jgi:hypothetical protein